MKHGVDQLGHTRRRWGKGGDECNQPLTSTPSVEGGGGRENGSESVWKREGERARGTWHTIALGSS